MVEDLLDPSVACPAAPVEELRQVRLEVALEPFPDERLGQHFVGSASRDVLLDGRRSAHAISGVTKRQEWIRRRTVGLLRTIGLHTYLDDDHNIF